MVQHLVLVTDGQVIGAVVGLHHHDDSGTVLVGVGGGGGVVIVVVPVVGLLGLIAAAHSQHQQGGGGDGGHTAEKTSHSHNEKSLLFMGESPRMESLYSHLSQNASGFESNKD